MKKFNTCAVATPTIIAPILNVIVSTAFRKRVLVFLMAIILCFNTVCKPFETKAAADPVTTGVIVSVCAAAAGMFFDLAGDGIKALVKYVRGGNEDMADKTDEEIVQYFHDNITINGDGNYILTDDANFARPV